MKYFFESERESNEAINVSGVHKVTARDLRQNIRSFFGDRRLLQLLSRRKDVLAELREVFELISEGRPVTPSSCRRLKNYMDKHPEIKDALINLFSSPEDRSEQQESDEW